jgi:cytochrome c-type biogenesis protein CcmH/NrfF
MCDSSNEPVILSEVQRGTGAPDDRSSSLRWVSAERHEESAAAVSKSRPRRPSGPARWLQCTEALLLAVAVCFSVGAASPTSRLNTLSHRLMCQCGCAQLLGECDHVGCPDRDKELSELSTEIAAGLTDQEILNSFVSKYGMTVLAAPPAKGFDLVAWIAPFAVFGAALLGTILLIRRWGGLGGKPQVAAAEPAFVDPAERERIERIRRETGSDGGF